MHASEVRGLLLWKRSLSASLLAGSHRLSYLQATEALLDL